MKGRRWLEGQGDDQDNRNKKSGATVLGRLKGWLLTVLAMLTRKTALRVALRACGAVA